MSRPTNSKPAFHPRQTLGKYRIVRRIAEGGFAEIYEAFDTIEGVRVALRVPRAGLDQKMLDTFRREVRLVSRFEHPNILPVKSADRIDGHFVVSTLLGEGTLLDELDRRLPTEKVLDYTEQLLSAVAHAHEHGVIHCDVKPDNVILFSRGRLRLTDFGIARLAASALDTTGSGTIGWLAPEHALGRPTLRSDVFALGLVVWQMLSGSVPEWPFDWPPPSVDKVRRRVHPAVLGWLEKAMQVDQRRRYPDAVRMLDVFTRLKASRKLLPAPVAARPARKRTPTDDLKTLRQRLFVKRFRKVLDLTHSCGRCGGAMAEAMKACPWCGKKTRRYRGPTRFPARCARCGRGRKLDWRFCPWCHGPGFREVSSRTWSDKRYVKRCTNQACTRRLLMPFMRYCPWCRTKVQRPWTFENAEGRCKSCRWSVVTGFWEWCPWCAKRSRRAR